MSASSWLHNRRGEWYVVIQATLILLVIFGPRLDASASGVYLSFVTIIGGLMCLVGLSFIVLGLAALGRNLSPFPKPRDGSNLVESGIFSVVRHPIYSGVTLCAFGWGLVWSSIVVLIAALVLLLFFDIKARREERWLEAKFGGYAAYKARRQKARSIRILTSMSSLHIHRQSISRKALQSSGSVLGQGQNRATAG